MDEEDKKLRNWELDDWETNQALYQPGDALDLASHHCGKLRMWKKNEEEKNNEETNTKKTMKAMKTMKRPSAMVDGKAMKAMKVAEPKEKARPTAMQAMKAMKAIKTIKKKPAKQRAPQTVFLEPFPIDSSLVDAPEPQQKELLRRIGIALSKYNQMEFHKDSKQHGLQFHQIAFSKYNKMDSAALVGALLDSGITLALDRFSFSA